jgi:hypothetical protein
MSNKEQNQDHHYKGKVLKCFLSYNLLVSQEGVMLYKEQRLISRLCRQDKAAVRFLLIQCICFTQCIISPVLISVVHTQG